FVRRTFSIAKNGQGYVARTLPFVDDAPTVETTVKKALEKTVKDNDARVLLVDDDRQLGSMLKDYFSGERLHLTASTSGEEGLQKFTDEAFDLLILDIMLPGLSGLEVLQRVRRSSDVPVIMLTARGDD